MDEAGCLTLAAAMIRVALSHEAKLNLFFTLPRTRLRFRLVT